MARLRHSDFQRELVEAISYKIQKTIQKDEFRKSITQNLRQKILERIKLFKEEEKKLWDNLGIDKNAEYVNLTDFKNRTGHMKDMTGYTISYNGQLITGRNRLLAKVSPKAEGNFNPHQKNPFLGNQYVASASLGLTVYCLAEYASYVDNPAMVKNKHNGTAYKQGTGWLRLYQQSLIYIFYKLFPETEIGYNTSTDKQNTTSRRRNSLFRENLAFDNTLNLPYFNVLSKTIPLIDEKVVEESIRRAFATKGKNVIKLEEPIELNFRLN